MKKKVTTLFVFVKQVLTEFASDNVLKYSAALAYYTVFSLAPMLIIIIAMCGFLFGKEAIQGQVYTEIKGLVGSPAALQIQDTIKNIHLTKDTPIASIISIIILILGGTGIFGEIQDSLNRIWGLKVKTNKAWWKLLMNRLLSFSLIISLGFVLIVSLLLNVLIAIVGQRLNIYFSGIGTVFIPFIENLLSFSITTFLFALMFKLLPDAKIKWKDVIIGAFITAVFFMLGKLGIGYYVGKSNIASIYGTAGSVVIIMVWAYYSAAIFYMGAEFTKVYAKQFGGKILPNDYSVWVRVEEVPVAAVALKNKVVN